LSTSRGTDVAVLDSNKEKTTMNNNSIWAKRALNLAVMCTAMVGLACAQAPKKVSFDPTTSPAEVISKLDADVNQGYAAQVDVLAPDDFSASLDDLAKARNEMREGKSQSRVLSVLGESRSYMDRAMRRADERRPRVEGILDARQAAIQAGARDFPRQREQLSVVDQQMRQILMEKSVNPKEFAKVQSDYMALELASVQSRYLSDARARIDGSKRKNAARFTPRTLNRAELDMLNAENMIASHRHDEAAFRQAVAKTNASSQLLADVAVKVRSGKAVLPEDVALKLVFQERGLGRMKGRVESLEAETEQTSEILSAQDQELKKARETQALDTALAQARKEFTSQQADVFRDGNRLLIRLKGMNFASGRSDVPASSLPLLEKVRVVAEDLSPQQILIEGHTDAIGNASVNGALSQKRAEAVASYLETTAGFDRDKIQAVGYGFKKPIASNKSKEGRAQNRRVDVIILPSVPETATTSM
jgi:outer membrane protein OmpA-like peptidoglycan-associated protein